VGAFAVEERSLIWRAGGAGSREGRVLVVGWGAPAEAIGSVRVAVVGVGVGWAELRIAGESVSGRAVFGHWGWRRGGLE
jgi:hypothetical protein